MSFQSSDVLRTRQGTRERTRDPAFLRNRPRGLHIRVLAWALAGQLSRQVLTHDLRGRRHER